MSFQDHVDALDRSEWMSDKRKLAVIGAAVVVIIGIAIIAFNYVSTADASGFEVVEGDGTAEVQDAGGEDAPQTEVCVYVTGCVAHPGVVYLADGSRVADAIEACGGMTAEASASSVNLARAVQDGEQISVLSAREVEQASAAMQGGSAGDTVAGSAASVGAAVSAQGGKVNINTASVSELQTLSGIGESKAAKIVEHREKNGLFKSVDDLTNVSGIGEKTLESLRDSICV